MSPGDGNGVGTSKAVATETPDKRNEKRSGRKRKSKDSCGAVTAFTAPLPSKPTLPRTVRPTKKQQKREKERRLPLPHVPGFEIPLFLRDSAAVPATAAGENPPAPTDTTKNDSHGNSNNKGSDLQRESQRLHHVLYTDILRPDLRPSERRILLANEISASVTTLEQQRSSRHLPSLIPSSRNSDSGSASPSLQQPPSHCLNEQRPASDHEIHKRIQQSQAIYKEDLDIFPEGCNTTGMWRWLESSGYLEEGRLDREEDVLGELERCWLPNGVGDERCSEDVLGELERCWLPNGVGDE